MKKKYPICPTCKNRHPQHNDGFEYLDCMLFYNKKDNEKRKSNINDNGYSFFISSKQPS